MPIQTNFAFEHFTGLAEAGVAAAPPDFLGLLRGFVGSAPAAKPTRTWKGRGYNLIWRPHTNPDHFLQLMHTDETLSFIDITGTGVANRGQLQDDIALGAAAYTQEINNLFDGKGQHFEPGVWVHVPKTDHPDEPDSVVRMGSIPHGTTINLQGLANDIDPKSMDSRIFKSSVAPFNIGSPDDGKTGVIPFPELQLGFANPPPPGFATRTSLNEVPGLTQGQLSDPNTFLREANAELDFTAVTEINIGSNQTLVPQPDAGGGDASIAFLVGKGANQENASVPATSATFWIQKARDKAGREIVQLQYSQRVLLNFATLSWPHVTVGTLRPV